MFSTIKILNKKLSLVIYCYYGYYQILSIITIIFMKIYFLSFHL